MDILSELVRQQQDQIGALTAKLSFLLSMFGLAEDDISLPPLSVSEPAGADTIAERTSSNLAQLQHLSASSINTVNKGVPGAVDGPSQDSSTKQSVRNAADKMNYSNAVRQKQTAVTTFRTAVAKAVYVETKTLQNRSRNFVVSGLQIIEGQSDRERVATLCKRELNIQPDIVTCKRLGQLIEGKIQPLLVSVSTSDQASRIISRAKLLRSSNDISVSNSVYINAHQTKAESQAAYEMRCLRRAGKREGRVWTATGRSVEHRVEQQDDNRSTPTGTEQQSLQHETIETVIMDTTQQADDIVTLPAFVSETVHQAGSSSQPPATGRLD